MNSEPPLPTLKYHQFFGTSVVAADDPELQKILERKMLELQRGDVKVEAQHGSTTLTDAEFQRVISNSTPTIVDFWAEWCGPCRVMHPVFEKLAKKYSGKMNFARLNVDENPGTPSSLGIFSIPTFVVFKGGQVIDTVVGAVGEAGLEKVIQKHIA